MSEIMSLRNSDVARAIAALLLIGALDVQAQPSTAPGSQIRQSQVQVSGNTTMAPIQAEGASVQTGAGTSQADVKGRINVNAVDLSSVDASNAHLQVLDNQLTGLVSALGGQVAVNTIAVNGDDARTTLSHSTFVLADAQAGNVRATGGSASLSRGLLNASMPGSANVNGIQVDSAKVQRSTLATIGARAHDVNAVGGQAVANALSVSQGELNALHLGQTDNHAKNIQAVGGSASAGTQFLAEADLSSLAAANAVVASQSKLTGATLTQGDNNTSDLVVMGGTALANSIRFAGQTKTLRQYQALQLNNRARAIHAEGGSGALLSGAAGQVKVASTALANAISLDGDVALQGTTHALINNEAHDVHARGGLAAANSIVMSQGDARAAQVTLINNQASRLDVSGYSAGMGMNFLGNAHQDAVVLANALGVTRSDVDANALTLADNTTSRLTAKGGAIMANSISLENDGRAASRLSASTTLMRNTATGLSASASSFNVAGGMVSSTNSARIAANTVLLKDGARIDAGSTLAFVNNQAQNVTADGGTVLVNALALYRDAQITATPVTLTDNQAQNLSAQGSSKQAFGFGESNQGVLVANSVYLQGDGTPRLSNSSVALRTNRVDGAEARGGRVDANALAVNGQGRVEGSAALLSDNEASQLSSAANEKTAFWFGHSGSTGYASANTLRVLGTLRDSSVAIRDNTATKVGAGRGTALANSVVIESKGSIEKSQISIERNTADLHVTDGKKGFANSLYDEGRITDNSHIRIAGNTGSVQRQGAINSVFNRGKIQGADVLITGNQGKVINGGLVNSVDNRGTLRGTVAITNNTGTAAQGGTINSLINRGTVTGKVLIASNTGSVNGRGNYTNSVLNNGTISGSVKILKGSTKLNGAGDAVAGNSPRPLQTGALTPSGGTLVNTITVGTAGAPIGH